MSVFGKELVLLSTLLACLWGNVCTNALVGEQARTSAKAGQANGTAQEDAVAIAPRAQPGRKTVGEKT